MKLSILIPTIGRRYNKFLLLVEYLTKQVEGLPIEIVAFWNTCEYPIGKIRQKLVEDAKGEYVCFIDDDDWVPGYYCQSIIDALGKDYVGFDVDVQENGNHRGTAFHSLQYTIWRQEEPSYYRGVTHLNPIRRELALQGTFHSNGAGEDEDWARTMTPITKTENYLGKIMYIYRHDTQDTMFGGKSGPLKQYERPEFEHKQFRYHKLSKQRGCMK